MGGRREEEARIESPTGRFLALIRRETNQVRTGRNRGLLRSGKDIKSKATDAEKRQAIIPGRERMALGRKGDGEEEGLLEEVLCADEVKLASAGRRSSDQRRSSGQQ